LTDWQLPTPRRVRAIRDRLRLVYGIPLAEPHGHPIGELILTVLSQSTNDRNRDIAYLGLRQRFPEWTDVRDAPVDLVEEAIRPGGISKIKSARIKSILRAITDNPRPIAGDEPSPGDRTATEPSPGDPTPTGPSPGDPTATEPSPGDPTPTEPSPGDLCLGWLAAEPVETARDYLVALPGVGRKTAACVRLFALGMREVPVDTHVSRVGWRLGLFRPGAPFEELHDTMLEITPPGEEWELHINLLRHGRRTCHAQRPACRACALRRMCPSADTFIGANGPTP
jgi:endonuclease III